MIFPVFASHMRIVRSSDPEAIDLPSGDHVTERMVEVCPINGDVDSTGIPVAASHMRMVKSRNPETMCLPSGDSATENTQSVYPSSGISMTFSVFADRMWTVRSPEPEAIHIPLGDHDTERTACPTNGSPTGCPVAASQVRIVLSDNPEMIRVLSGENATQFACPGRLLAGGLEEGTREVYYGSMW